MNNSATEKMKIYIIFVVLFIAATATGVSFWEVENGNDQCDLAIRETIIEDRATIVDNTPSRLQATWFSHECETRTGPEYVIRKYTFYKNGTFLLMRHHYAEESCSVATYTVTARGSIELQSASFITPGTTEAKYHLHTVYIVPLNRQVAHKLGHRVNVSCSPQPRWRPHAPHLIYARPFDHFESLVTWAEPRYNFPLDDPMRSRRGLDCLEPLGINFDELRLLRVQKKSRGFWSSVFEVNKKPKVELLFGSLPTGTLSRKTHRPTSLQPTSLIRIDSASGCPICGIIARGTENSPPLLHEVAALPTLLGGSWLTTNCESHPNGLWRKREIRFFHGDKLWMGRWDYYLEPQCMLFFYSISAAGSYIQRDTGKNSQEGTKQTHFSQHTDGDVWSRMKRNSELSSDTDNIISEMKYLINIIDNEQNSEEVSIDSQKQKEMQEITKYEKSRRRRNLEDDDSYKQLLESAQPSMADSLAAILRGNQKQKEPVKKTFPQIPAGTTELDLHVAESVLIPGDQMLAARCGRVSVDQNSVRRPLTHWPSDCVPASLTAPSTIGLRARVGVDWNGQYTLLLGDRESSIWEAPLRQCGPTSMKNPSLRSHLRKSVSLRFGLTMASSSKILTPLNAIALVILQFFVYRAL